MADLTPSSEAGGTSDPSSPPGVPGWVKLLGIIIAVVIVIVVVVLITGGGEHGPGRHL